MIPVLGYAQGQCGSHHKWPRNCYQHLRPLDHHNKDRKILVLRKTSPGRYLYIENNINSVKRGQNVPFIAHCRFLSEVYQNADIRHFNFCAISDQIIS